jgi:bifunctional DNA-binding transcriptional regulator/antitoxin component of YhaV-PrlF toxin-antitoxin module
LGKVAKVESKYKVNVDVKGTILGVRQVTNRGRVQIPRIVKRKLKINDKDNVYWIELDGRIYLMKAVDI